jgi:hypothetical protein
MAIKRPMTLNLKLETCQRPPKSALCNWQFAFCNLPPRLPLWRSASLREAHPKSATVCQPPTYANPIPRFPPKIKKGKRETSAHSFVATWLTLRPLRQKKNRSRPPTPKPAFRSPLSAFRFQPSTLSPMANPCTSSASHISQAALEGKRHNLIHQQQLTAQQPARLPHQKIRKGKRPANPAASILPLGRLLSPVPSPRILPVRPEHFYSYHHCDIINRRWLASLAPKPAGRRVS